MSKAIEVSVKDMPEVIFSVRKEMANLLRMEIQNPSMSVETREALNRIALIFEMGGKI